MEAHNVKYGTRVKVIDAEVEIPPSSIPVKQGDEIKIFKLDGTYCNGLNADGDMVYIAGWTEVELIP